MGSLLIQNLAACLPRCPVGALVVGIRDGSANLAVVALDAPVDVVLLALVRLQAAECAARPVLGWIALAFAATFAVRCWGRCCLLLPMVTADSVLLALAIRRSRRLLVFPLGVTSDGADLLSCRRRLLDENVGAERQRRAYAIVMSASRLRFPLVGRALMVGLTLTVVVRAGRASFKLGIRMRM